MQKGVHSAQTPSPEQIRALVSAIDKAAKRGIIHRNAAIRRKARLQSASRHQVGGVGALR